MKITIGGAPCSGKSTVGKLLAKKIGYNYYYIGGIQRDIAEEKKISMLELGELEEKDPSLDMEVDQRQIDIGRNEDDFIMDGRLSFHFVKDSIKIFIDADFEERAKRILADRIRKELNVDLENTKENINKRVESEKKRFKEYYHVDPFDKGNYDLVLDTTDLTPEEAVEKIMKFIKKQ